MGAALSSRESVFEFLQKEDFPDLYTKIFALDKLQELYESIRGQSLYRRSEETLSSSSSSTEDEEFVVESTFTQDDGVKRSFVSVCDITDRERFFKNMRDSSLPDRFVTMSLKKLASMVDIEYAVGAGSFGMVCLGIDKRTSQKVAVKFTKIETDDAYDTSYFFHDSDRTLLENYMMCMLSKIPDVDFFSKVSKFYRVTHANLNIVGHAGNKLAPVVGRNNVASVVIMEPFLETFYEHAKLSSFPDDQLYGQCLYAIYYLQQYLKTVHFDLHVNNVMLMKCDDDIPDREYKFEMGTSTILVKSPYRICVTDFGFSASDVFMGKGSCASMYQMDMKTRLQFTIDYVVPMNVYDLFRFAYGSLSVETAVVLVKYILFRYKKLYERVTGNNDFPETIVPESMLILGHSFNLCEANPKVKMMNEIMQDLNLLPLDFKYISAACVEHALKDHIRRTGCFEMKTLTSARKRSRESSEGQYTSYELMKNDEFPLDKSLASKFGAPGYFDPDIVPTYPIPAVATRYEFNIHRIISHMDNPPEMAVVRQWINKVCAKFGPFIRSNKFRYESMGYLCSKIYGVSVSLKRPLPEFHRQFLDYIARDDVREEDLLREDAEYFGRSGDLDFYLREKIVKLVDTTTVID